MKQTVNLLPIAVRNKYENMRQLRAWTLVVITVLIILSISQVTIDFLGTHAQLLLAHLEQRIEPVRKKDEATRLLEQELRDHEAATAQLVDLEQADSPLMLLQVISDCCVIAGTKVELETIKVDEIGSVGNSTSQAPTQRRILLTGSAPGDAQVTALVNSLRAAGIFDKVALDVSQASTSSGGDSDRSFQISCTQRN